MLRESKYPNVTVDCSECDGSGFADTDIQTVEAPCPDCNGTGKVPSAEEWAIHDYEGFGGWKLSESEDIDSIAAYAEAISDLDDSESEAFQAWVDNQPGYTVDCDSLESFWEEYQGFHKSLADYAYDYIEQTDSLPKDLPAFIKSNIDYEGIGRDFELDGDIWTHQGEHGLHVFSNH